MIGRCSRRISHLPVGWVGVSHSDVIYGKSQVWKALNISPNPPNGVVGVAEREIRDMEERLSGRFWTVGVSGRSAVVVSSRSPRDRTSRGRSLAGLGRVWVTLG